MEKRREMKKTLTIILLVFALAQVGWGDEKTLSERLDPDGDGYVIAGGEYVTTFNWRKLKLEKKPRKIPIHYFSDVKIESKCNCATTCIKKEKKDEEKPSIIKPYGCDREDWENCGHDTHDDNGIGYCYAR